MAQKPALFTDAQTEFLAQNLGALVGKLRKEYEARIGELELKIANQSLAIARLDQIATLKSANKLIGFSR